MSFSKLPVEILFNVCEDISDDAGISRKATLRILAKVNQQCREVALEVLYRKITCHCETIGPILQQLFGRQHLFAKIKEISLGNLPFEQDGHIGLDPDLQARLYEAIGRLEYSDSERIRVRESIAEGSLSALIEILLRLTPNIDVLEAMGKTIDDSSPDVEEPR
jgi:hypothetical protein